MFPLCEMAPLVATTVFDDVPPVAEVETLNVTAWLAPAASENDEEGEGVTSCGIACSSMCTDPVKPFFGFTVIVTGVVIPPTPIETDEGEIEILKSGAGGGGEGAELPPQPIRTIKAAQAKERTKK
jgi:hypothetical protein